MAKSTTSTGHYLAEELSRGTGAASTEKEFDLDALASREDEPEEDEPEEDEPEEAEIIEDAEDESNGRSD